jgi:putative flippase GtrA
LTRPLISPDFLRFGVVGTLGFCWDTATVYTVRLFANLYVAGAAGFLVAATANWLLNRIWTFRHKTHGAAHRQWVRFMLANSVGFVLNRGVFFTLITASPLCHRMPVLPIIAGSFAGLTFNYFLSKRFVFR